MGAPRDAVPDGTPDGAPPGGAERATAAAFRHLGRRDHLRAELEAKLRRQGFTEVEVEGAIGRCVRLGLIDDRTVAERFVAGRARARGWGPARLEVELRRRGASRELAAAAVEAAAPEPEVAVRAALDRLERRAPAGWWRLPARRARMVSSLTGRGFAADEAYRAVAERARERGSESDAGDDQPGDPEDFP